MTSSLTSGGHYTEKHPSYNIYDLSPNIVSSFNNYSKSWLMHAYNIRAISGDDLIIEVSGNNRIIFQEHDHSYNLCDLTGFKVLNKNLIATDANVRIPISYNNYSFADPTTLLTNLTLNGSYVDLTGSGYTLKYAPSTVNSKVHVRAKINYKSSAGTEQLITFRLMRDISGGSTGDILMTDSSLGAITGVTNHGIYNLEYVDSPATEEDVRYYLKYRIEAADSDIVVSSGVLGYDDENQNFFSAQEIYIPATYQYVPKDCACEQMINYHDSIVVAGGSGTNTLVYSLNNGEEWKGLGNGVITNTCNDIVWSTENNKFIAVGSGSNTIAYSARDAKEWRDVSLSTSIFSTSGNGITWSGLRFVAVGEGTNTIAHSGDGLYWRAVPSSTSIFSTRGNKVAYGNNRFIAVGEGTNTIAYSDDGMNWVGLGNSVFSTAGYAIIWNGERWVAGGQGTNTLAYSNDNGYSWIGLGIVPFTTKVMGLATNDISMVAVGSGFGGAAATIAYSSNNGLSWTQATSVFASSSTGTSVSWVGDRFIATSDDATHTSGYSYDGINWTGLGNSELSTTANAVSTNKGYLKMLDTFPDLTGMDVSFRHLDLSGNLEVSGNAQIHNILIDTNKISTTDAIGHLDVLATNGAMNNTSNLDMSLISLTGTINIQAHQNTLLTSQNGQMALLAHQEVNLQAQNGDMFLTSSAQDVHITSHQNTNLTSQNAQTNITAAQQNNITAQAGQTNLTAHQQNNITAQNGQTNITTHQQFAVQAQNGDINLTSSAKEINLISHQNTGILSQTGDINVTSSAQDINIISHQQTNLTSQNAQVNITSSQQTTIQSQTGQVSVISSQGNIQMTSHQQTTIASQNNNVVIQSTGSGTTQIGPSATVDNIRLDGNKISELDGGGLQLESTTNVVAISSGGGDTTISPSLQVDNINLDSNIIKSNTGTIDFNSNNLVNIQNMTVGGVQNSFVPAGIIVMWSGADGAIPTGWALCNGSNGTPDLRGRFIISSTYSAGIGGLYGGGQTTNVSTTQTGGSHDHVLSIAEMPVHNHGGNSGNTSADHTHGVSTTTGNESAQHTHGIGGNTGNANATHTHSVSANAGQGGVDHIHGGTAATANAGHAHPISLGSGGSHSHPISIQFSWSESPGGWAGNRSVVLDDQDYGLYDLTQVGGSPANKGRANIGSDGSHSHPGSSAATANATHDHTVSISPATAFQHVHPVGGTAAAETTVHSHSLPTNTGQDQHNHTHSFNTTSQNQSVTHHHDITTTQTGGGGYHNNQPAYYVLAFIMKLA